MCCVWDFIRVTPLTVKCESGGAQGEHTPASWGGQCHGAIEALTATYAAEGWDKREVLGGKGEGDWSEQKGGSNVSGKGDTGWGEEVAGLGGGVTA